MLHVKSKFWTIVIILFVTGSVVSNLHSQTIGIQMGTHLIPDKVLFEKPLSNTPRPFMFVGLTYCTKEVTMGLSYTFDLHIWTVSSSLPLWNVNKKKYSAYALINNRK